MSVHENRLCVLSNSLAHTSLPSGRVAPSWGFFLKKGKKVSYKQYKAVDRSCIHDQVFRSYDDNMVPTDTVWELMTGREQQTLLDLYEPLNDLLKLCTNRCSSR